MNENKPENTNNTNTEKNEKKTSDSTSVSTGQWKECDKTVHRSFPGPRYAQALFRIAFDRNPYADLVAHAKENLSVEVCGVLVGNICEDEEGHFLHVSAIIKGYAASQAGAHVTFTQETWNEIHKTMEKEHSNKEIVGWYHTHPGFGVEFSDMDLFIQKNFFPSFRKIALVTDPLKGDVAICLNSSEGIRHIDRFWVDGREVRCYVPKAASSSSNSKDKEVNLSEFKESLEILESRVRQLLQAQDELRLSIFRTVLSLCFVICLSAVLAIGYYIYTRHTAMIPKPPEIMQYSYVPIKLGNKMALLTVAVLRWTVPPELEGKYFLPSEEDKDKEDKSREGKPSSPSTEESGAEKVPEKPGPETTQPDPPSKKSELPVVPEKPETDGKKEPK